MQDLSTQSDVVAYNDVVDSALCGFAKIAASHHDFAKATLCCFCKINSP